MLLPLLTAAVTAAFYFILKAFNTADLAVSTVSVATSFAAVYLTFRRSALYALAYAANDAVLVTLWLLAASRQMQYYSVAVCFAAFLANDIYGFINWRRMEKKQAAKMPPAKVSDHAPACSRPVYIRPIGFPVGFYVSFLLRTSFSKLHSSLFCSPRQ